MCFRGPRPIRTREPAHLRPALRPERSEYSAARKAPLRPGLRTPAGAEHKGSGDQVAGGLSHPRSAECAGQRAPGEGR